MLKEAIILFLGIFLFMGIIGCDNESQLQYIEAKEENPINDIILSDCESNSEPIKICQNCSYWVYCDNGNSMMPIIDCNSTLTVKDCDDAYIYDVGDIIMFKNKGGFLCPPDKCIFMVHYIYDIEGEYITTKGIALNTLDAINIKREDIMGLVINIER